MIPPVWVLEELAELHKIPISEALEKLTKGMIDDHATFRTIFLRAECLDFQKLRECIKTALQFGTEFPPQILSGFLLGITFHGDLNADGYISVRANYSFFREPTKKYPFDQKLLEFKQIFSVACDCPDADSAKRALAIIHLQDMSVQIPAYYDLEQLVNLLLYQITIVVGNFFGGLSKWHP